MSLHQPSEFDAIFDAYRSGDSLFTRSHHAQNIESSIHIDHFAGNAPSQWAD